MQKIFKQLTILLFHYGFECVQKMANVLSLCKQQHSVLILFIAAVFHHLFSFVCLFVCFCLHILKCWVVLAIDTYFYTFTFPNDKLNYNLLAELLNINFLVFTSGNNFNGKISWILFVSFLVFFSFIFNLSLSLYYRSV